MKLNLGSGSKPKPGYLNVDAVGTPDLRCDLSSFPWPWDDNSVDEVYSEHFLEHVDDFEQTILEIHRILKPGGILHFTVPHFRSPPTVWHLHKWQFSTATPERLCESLPYQWEGRALFRKQRITVNMTQLPQPLSHIVGWLARRAPKAWDWFGLPIDEVEFIGRKR